MKLSNSIKSLLTLIVMTTSMAQAQTKPGQAYLEIHKRELAANSFEELLPLRSKASIANDKPMSAEEKKMFFPLFKMTAPKVVLITSEQVNGSKATVTAKAVTGKLPEGTTESTVGVIDLVLEDGQWKLEKEKWESKSVITK
jgi:hypothetical protein